MEFVMRDQASRAEKVLEWRPARDGREILYSAWNWEHMLQASHYAL